MWDIFPRFFRILSHIGVKHLWREGTHFKTDNKLLLFTFLFIVLIELGLQIKSNILNP